MADQMAFDEETAARLEAVYRSRDIVRRRGLALGALDAQPGDHVVDVGCGPGFYVEDLLPRVGDRGRITAVDPAPAMRAMTERRVAGRGEVAIVEGTATALPPADAGADRVLVVQVLEYEPDIDAALAELLRVLRPGGRLVVWDIDWSTLSWHAQDAGRMARMQDAWDRHLVHTTLPRTLGASLAGAGFTDVVAEGHPFVTRALDPETFGGYLPDLIGEYVRGLGDEALDREVDGWLEDLRELDARGAYFFALTQFCFSAARPA